MDFNEWDLNDMTQQPPRPADEMPQNEANENAGAAAYAQTQTYGTARNPETVFTDPLNPGPASIRNDPPQREKPKRAKRGLGKAIIALSLCCALIGGILGAGGVLLFSDRTKDAGTSSVPKASDTVNVGPSRMLISRRENPAVETASAEAGTLLTASQVYEQNVNSTVGITTEVTTNYFGYPSTSAAAGSGFILTEDGYILTNQHVIDGANSIRVAMNDGKTYEAKLIGQDASNDIAVLKIEAAGLTPVVLGDSDTLKVGEDVMAIGNPLGELTFSLTKGVVSALDRPITLSSGVTMKLIQTDCSINSGNSGGALFNLYGEVIGITNAKYSSNAYSNEASIDNIGFAIPINQVKEIVESIINNGYIAKPYIGVTVADVSEESQGYGLPKGASVKSVEADSPAEKAGLKVNDIITGVNGETITSYQDLSDYIKQAGVDAKLELTVYRQGKTLKLSVTVGERIQSAVPEEQSDTDAQSGATPAQPSESSNPFGGFWPFG